MKELIEKKKEINRSKRRAPYYFNPDKYKRLMESPIKKTGFSRNDESKSTPLSEENDNYDEIMHSLNF